MFSLRTHGRVFFRSLFIQAGFSPEALQSLGVLYAIEPALKVLYPNDHDRQTAIRRHLTPFNTHPYVATGMIGGILYYESRIARGEASTESVTRFKETLMGPLAVLGDGFFWLSLRPAISALSCALVPLIGLWTMGAFLIAYNVIHLSARFWLYWVGVTQGDGLVVRIQGTKIPMWSNRLRTLAAAAAGVLGAGLALRFGAQEGGSMTLWLALMSFGVGIMTVAMVERHLSPYWAMYGFAAAAVLAGAML